MTENASVVLRWRMANGTVPLKQRHLRSLEPLDLPDPLMGWIHERLEWAISNMLYDNAKGVLVLKIDKAHEVTITLDDFRLLPALDCKNLLVENGFITGVRLGNCVMETVSWKNEPGRMPEGLEGIVEAGKAEGLSHEIGPGIAQGFVYGLEGGILGGIVGGIAGGIGSAIGGLVGDRIADKRTAETTSEFLQGTVWLEYEGMLHVSCDPKYLVAATSTLAKDLADTLGLPLDIQLQPIEAAENASVFLISDEFGFVLLQDNPKENIATNKLQECFSKLW